MLVVVLLGWVAGAACQREPVDRAVLNAWLTCVECTDGELDSVQALARRAPATVDTLQKDLLQGPSPFQRDQLTVQMQTSYQRLATYNANDPTSDSLGFSQAEFVARYLGNVVMIYQGRAAYGLGAIGGIRARQALDSALQFSPDSFPPNVWAQIHFARDSLIGP